MADANLLLHPIRLRIIQAFLGDRALTTGQLNAELPDVPPGSLYRHVGLLVSAGVLSVVAERRVRGVVERTYVLRESAAYVNPEMTIEEHRRAFMTFIAGLLGDFDRYLALGQPDLVRDGVGYRLGAMWLSDVEFTEFLRDLARVIQPRMANAPSPARRRRVVAGVTLPTSPAPKTRSRGRQRKDRTSRRADS
ncbi:MAG: helix-turn-helix domain-containing protein [Candidatus Dormiibacterota bacterium]